MALRTALWDGEKQGKSDFVFPWYMGDSAHRCRDGDKMEPAACQ